MAQRFYCGVPTKQCQGSTIIQNRGLTGKIARGHVTNEEAFECYRRWLISQGYERIGPREYALPGEPILILTKRTKFGTRMRLGKSQEGKGSRYMPRSGGGLIFSS